MCRCEELVSSYLSDNDPDAVLAVGADMRKIQYCFLLLKVINGFLCSSVITGGKYS